MINEKMSKNASAIIANVSMKLGAMQSKDLISKAILETGDDSIKTRKEAIYRLVLLELAYNIK